jgi:phage baseplate assembly protein W
MVGKVDAAIRDALARWEPRIEVTEIDFDLSGVDDGRLDITIGFRVRATSSSRNLVYPFYVIPAEESE